MSEVDMQAPRSKSAVHLPCIVPPTVAKEEEVPVPAAAHIPSQAADEFALLPPGSTAPTQRVRRPKEMIRKGPGAISPEIALAGGLVGRVVVVPAEQVRRQREEAARPPVVRPRAPVYGNRSAFDALFKD